MEDILKQLLLKDLCARLPYGTIIQVKEWATLDSELKFGHIERLQYDEIELKPYLRPMSSMTEEERLELSRLSDDKFKFYLYTTKSEIICYEKYNYLEGLKVLDWLNAHHFDYRGLTELGLALPAPEGMYNIK